MSMQELPFQEPIEEGLIRIFLRIDGVECEVENDAPDFVDAKEDTPQLTVAPEADIEAITEVFKTSFPLMLNERKTKEGKLFWELDQGGVWFDVEMDDVKDIWLSEFNFFIESSKPRYLAYYITDVVHSIEWLQPDAKTGEIKSLSNFKKKFTPPPVTEKDVYSGADILKCADMLGRAIKKIDLRTKDALVKFNTEKGNLEPVLLGIADRLGYKISVLDPEVIKRENEKGNSVSHSISLK